MKRSTHLLAKVSKGKNGATGKWHGGHDDLQCVDIDRKAGGPHRLLPGLPNCKHRSKVLQGLQKTQGFDAQDTEDKSSEMEAP